MSRTGLLAALVASVILSAGSAMAQEQPAGAAPAIDAPTPAAPTAPAPIAPAPAAPAVAPPATMAPSQPGTQPNTAAPAEAGPSTAMELTLPHDLSPWGMFMAADIVVKAVMIGLGFASLCTWPIWLA
ncbi:tonB-system energizer ExbB, partial [Mesorhizobium sp. M7A.F.Ca.US.014.04.1.1]